VKTETSPVSRSFSLSNVTRADPHTYRKTKQPKSILEPTPAKVRATNLREYEHMMV